MIHRACATWWILIALWCGSSAVAGELDPRVLFRAPDILSVSVSPSGEWIVATAHTQVRYGLLVQRVGHAKVTSIFSTKEPVEGVDWIDRETLLVRVGGSDRSGVRIIGLSESAGRIDVRRKRIRASGRLVDPLPLVDGTLLWQLEIDGVHLVTRVTVEQLRRHFAFSNRRIREPLDLGEVVVRLEGPISRWIVDRNGVPLAALRMDEGGSTLLVRDSSDALWREAHVSPATDQRKLVYPLAFAQNEKNLLVTAYHERDTLGLYEFDVSKGEISKEVFVHPDFDVVDVLLDHARREPLAVVYEEEGERRHHYLDDYAERHLRAVESRLRLDRVSVVSSDEGRTRFVLLASGSREPGTYYFHDSVTKELIRIAEAYQRIHPGELVDVESFRVASRDGTEVEAFLALPKSIPPGGAPLVVFPHGGPIGVRDNRDFNPLLQYIASAGMAVLNVNYRGSSGYGLRFESLGNRQWANGIEDDIDAATDLVRSRPEVDASRICIAGGSYGGFSALASIVRHKSRFRCAASINGVTDIPLLFDTSDWADLVGLRSVARQLIGDPERERRDLMDASPLYHVDRFHTPVLIVYGTRDRRVDPDHSHRLMLMMDVHDKKYEAVEVVGAGHSFTYLEGQAVFARLLEFLKKHLFVDPESEEMGAGPRHERR
jgi:dipeptidyl aminopeptidase/acylaminoacyl peptidase